MSSDTDKVAEALGLFASAIKCGEPWTETCERAHREAQEAMKRLATESAPAQPDEYCNPAATSLPVLRRRWWFRLLNKLCGGHVRNWRR